MRLKRLLNILMTACGLLFLASCSSSQDKEMKQASAIPVLAAEPIISNVPIFVTAVGTLRPSVSVDVRPQVSGNISEVLVTEGEWVATGSSLFKIDSSPYTIKVQEAAAKLEMDRAMLQAAQKKLERCRPLAEKDLISKSEWEELETAVEKASAAVQVDLASFDSARLDLGYCTLSSCVEGRVGKLDVHPGMLVSNAQATPLVTVVKMDPLLVEFTLTERDAGLLHPEQMKIEILSLHSSDVIADGNITFIDNHYDSKSGLILIRGKVANPKAVLRPGQNVRVRIAVSIIDQAKIIPQKAVKYNQEGPYIYVVGAESIVQLRKISLGLTQGQSVIVQEGLSAHEKVITDGHMRIYPGSKVEVKE